MNKQLAWRGNDTKTDKLLKNFSVCQKVLIVVKRVNKIAVWKRVVCS
jgi:hypothetical protein